MKPDEFINKYIGTPFVYNGRSTEGADCYGLVWLWYRDVCGVILPDWRIQDETARWVRNFITDKFEHCFIHIDDPYDGAVAFATGERLAYHVGIFFNQGIFHIQHKHFATWRDLSIAKYDFGGHVRYGIPNGRS